MEKPFAALPNTTLVEGSTCYQFRPDFIHQLDSNDAAHLAMTDLRKVAAITIKPDVVIDAANDKMIANGVRLLVVNDGNKNVAGIITAVDILGDKPLRHIQRFGGSRKDILVSDVMTSRTNLDVLSLNKVAEARIGDIVATLKRDGRQHALVVDEVSDTNAQIVCGIFSATQIGRLIGVPVEPSSIATTFSELEKVINL